ncbi:hypothetical protein, conserved [Leishmania tarentolae]|uniref:Hikeshi-like C-terminal domain-containing protein n=1 Tax=Leishmania tarentolae TaxID=5689 RepID=A0A640KEV5_LEITA|nr:hypothetical protein, conserved [Leishmania tarentolae]
MQWQQALPGLEAPYATASSNASPPLFGVIIPGYPVQTNISPIDTGRWTVSLGLAPESFVVFLTMSEPLPPGHGIGLFLAREDIMSFEYVGALTQQRASSLIKVPAVFLNAAQPIRIVLGLALEREEELENLGFTHEQPLQQAQAATKVAIAERILEDLYGFVVSYARTITLSGGRSANGLSPLDPGEYVVMPTSFVDKWRARLQSKITKDNAFWA